MKIWRVALWFEALSLLRLRTVYTFGLLPALALLPVTAVFTGVLASFVGYTTVAIPTQGVEGADLLEVLQETFEVVVSEDPRAAANAGEVDVAVVRWEMGPTSFSAELVGESNGTLSAVEQSLRNSMQAGFDDKVRAAGGDAYINGVVSTVHIQPVDLDARQMLWFSFLVASAYLGCFMLPVRTATERLSGTLEALVVTATPVGVLFAARALVSTLLFMLIPALPVLTILVMIPELPSIRIADLAECFTATLVINAVWILCGVATNSTRMALYAASYLVLLLVPVGAVVALLDVPWAPILGFADDGSLFLQILRIVLGLFLASAVIGLSAAIATRRALPEGAGQ